MTDKKAAYVGDNTVLTLNQKIKKHSEKFGIQDCIINILKHTKGFIAGSFALSVFLDEQFKSQDMDIYMRVPFTSEMYKNYDKKYYASYYTFEYLAKEYVNNLLEKRGYHVEYNMDRPLMVKAPINTSEISLEELNNEDTFNGYDYDYDKKKSVKCKYIRSGLSHFIKDILTFENKQLKTTIQIITLYDCKIHEYLDLFDLNICRIAIEYEEFEAEYSNYGYIENYEDNKLYNKLKGELVYYHDKNDYLNKYELSLISSKKMYIYNPMYPPNLPDRLIKYINRGFTWFDKRTGEQVEFNYITNNHSKKYSNEYYDFLNVISKCVQNLGFTIVVDYNNYLKNKYRLNFNKTVYHELVSKVFHPDRMLKMCKKYNMEFDELLNLY